MEFSYHVTDIVKGVSQTSPNLKSAHDMRTFKMTLDDDISKALPEGSKAAFDEYVRARADLSDMACEEDFVAGYQLGVRMMLGGWMQFHRR